MQRGFFYSLNAKVHAPGRAQRVRVACNRKLAERTREKAAYPQFGEGRSEGNENYRRHS